MITLFPPALKRVFCVNLWILCLSFATVCDGETRKTFSTARLAIKGQNFYPYAYYDGDILLTGLFPVRRLGKDQTTPVSDGKYVCGPIDMQDGIQVLEAMMFALDRINNMKLLKFRLGAIGLDTCQNADLALEQAVRLVEFVRSPFSNDSTQQCPGNKRVPSQEEVRMGKVVGVVGAAMSDVSISLANFLKLYRIPQISYFSTTPDLSNRLKFSFFLRTVPPDTQAVHAIVELLRDNKWFYVTVVFDDTNYGSRAFYAFEEYIANEAGPDKVCLAAQCKLELSGPQMPENEYHRCVRNIVAVPRVKVIVLFIAQTTVDGLFKALNSHPNQSKIAEFLWIGTDSWAGREGLKRTSPMILSRSINVMPKAYTNDEFTKYMKRLRPSQNGIRDPWLGPYFESKCNYSAQNHTKASVEPLEEKCANYVFANFKQMLYVHFVTDAIYAYAYALKVLEDKFCKSKPNCKLNVNAVDRKELMQVLRGINFTDISGENFKFDGIDGPPNYTILYYNSTNESYVIGGQYKGIERHPGLMDWNMKLNVTDAFKLHAQRFKESRCVDECGTNEAKQFLPHNQCCWVCTACSGPQIVRLAPNKTGSATRSVPGEKAASQCEACPDGSRPDTDRRSCETIPLKRMDARHPLAITVIIYCCLSIVVCFLIAGVFLYFRHTPLIKASGRETSFFLLAGIVLSYLLPLILVQAPSAVVCGVMRIAPGLCLTVCYAAILAKTNRIARIFHLGASGALGAKKPKFISPISQLYLCASLVTAELIILVIWLVLEPPASEIVADNISRNDLICRGQAQPNGLVGLLFPIVLLTLTTMYAFRVRKTPDGFNEARCLGFVNYANCVVIVTSLPIISIFNNLIHSALTVCFLLVTSATADLLGLFLPKIYTVFWRPDKNTREAVMSRTRSQSQVSLPGATAANATAHNSTNSHPNIVDSLERRASSVKMKDSHVHGVLAAHGSFARSVSGSSSLHLANPSFRSQKSVSFSEMNRVVDSCTDIHRQNSQRASLHSQRGISKDNPVLHTTAI